MNKTNVILRPFLASMNKSVDLSPWSSSPLKRRVKLESFSCYPEQSSYDKKWGIKSTADLLSSSRGSKRCEPILISAWRLQVNNPAADLLQFALFSLTVSLQYLSTAFIILLTNRKLSHPHNFSNACTIVLHSSKYVAKKVLRQKRFEQKN